MCGGWWNFGVLTLAVTIIKRLISLQFFQYQVVSNYVVCTKHFQTPTLDFHISAMLAIRVWTLAQKRYKSQKNCPWAICRTPNTAVTQIYAPIWTRVNVKVASRTHLSGWPNRMSLEARSTPVKWQKTHPFDWDLWCFYPCLFRIKLLSNETLN